MRSRFVCALLIVVLLGVLGACSKPPEEAKKQYLESGSAYLKDGKYQEARLQFRNALKIDPRYTEAYYLLAKADLAAARWDEAYSALQQTLRSTPTAWMLASASASFIWQPARTTRRKAPPRPFLRRSPATLLPTS